MTDLLNHEDFAPHVNSKFHLASDSHALELELTEVSELLVSNHQERFSLIFRGPTDRFVNQGTYRIQHDALGELELFLVPLGSNQEGVTYEAAFNRLRQNK